MRTKCFEKIEVRKQIIEPFKNQVIHYKAGENEYLLFRVS